MTTKTKSSILTIGWYQIVGGGTGFLKMLYSLFTTAQISGLLILINILILGFFIYSILCGTLCLKYKDNALTHSLINQFLQLISFACFSFSFIYVSGLYLSIGLDLSNSIAITFDFGISKFDFKIYSENVIAEMNFNLVAFGLIYWIDKLIKKIKEEKTNIEISSLGQS